MDKITKATVKYTLSNTYIFFQELWRYVAMAILDISKNEPITITGIATLVNIIDNPNTL